MCRSKSVVPFTTDSRNFVRHFAPWLKIASSNSSRSSALGRTVMVGVALFVDFPLVSFPMTLPSLPMTWNFGLEKCLHMAFLCDSHAVSLVGCRLKKLKHAADCAGSGVKLHASSAFLNVPECSLWSGSEHGCHIAKLVTNERSVSKCA